MISVFLLPFIVFCQSYSFLDGVGENVSSQFVNEISPSFDIYFSGYSYLLWCFEEKRISDRDYIVARNRLCHVTVCFLHKIIEGFDFCVYIQFVRCGFILILLQSLVYAIQLVCSVIFTLLSVLCI